MDPRTSDRVLERPRIFVSYSWADKPLARRVARRLSHCGAQVFLDEERQAELGMHSLSSAIEEAITQATHVVVIWTENAAESAKPGGWVARELEHADGRTASGLRLLPLLFFSPKAHPLVDDTLGVAFPAAHRFERSFADVLPRVFGATWNEPDVQSLERDFATTLRETPGIARAFSDPIQDALAAQGTQWERSESDLEIARRAFAGWKPEGVSRLGLPVAGETDYHALDFAMWCAARIVLSDERRERAGPGQHPVEIGTYPGIFAKLLGATGAGFESLLSLLEVYPGLAAVVLSELVRSADVSDPALPVVVELYDSVLRLVARSDGGRWDIPFEAASCFVRANRVRLSEDQKLTVFRLVDVGGDGPYPGGPLDLLGEFAVEPGFRDEVLQRVRHWVGTGLFDGVDPTRRAEAPSLFYGFVRSPFGREMPEEADALLETVAAPHIKRLLRSGSSSRVVCALRWVAQADLLSPASRRAILGAYEDGVYSAEFEAWEHAPTVRPPAEKVAWLLERAERVDYHVLSQLNRVLREAGLPEV